jgi:hypothetical protein
VRIQLSGSRTENKGAGRFRRFEPVRRLLRYGFDLIFFGVEKMPLYCEALGESLLSRRESSILHTEVLSIFARIRIAA